MGKIICIAALLLLASCKDCSQLKEGFFKIETSPGNTFTIDRTLTKQTENNLKSGVISECKIKWTSDCSYILYDRKLLKGFEPSQITDKLRGDTLYNEIISISGNTHKVSCVMKSTGIKAKFTVSKVK